MRILHTSDWHFGAYLEQHQRIEEQYQFIDELYNIAEEKNVDMILVAGDIYDTSNPPANAERLFYHAIKKLSAGKRPILIVAGNHDSPDRIFAPSSILYQNGAIVISLPTSVAEVGDYGFYKVIDSGVGYVEIEKDNERVVALTMPFPSEKRLNELVTQQATEKEMQKSFNDRIKEIFDGLSNKYREDTINIAIGHFHISGGETSNSERDIQFGGSFAVNSSSLPPNAQYIAMGHLHRAQKLAGLDNGYYSGSPIQYSVSEIAYTKCVYMVDLLPQKQAEIEKINLSCYKPIEIWEANSIENAIEICSINKDKNCWVYLKINSDRPIQRSENKEILSLKKDIVKIILNIKGEQEEIITEEFEERSILEEFTDFFKKENGVEPSQELLNLLAEISEE